MKTNAGSLLKTLVGCKAEQCGPETGSFFFQRFFSSEWKQVLVVQCGTLLCDRALLWGGVGHYCGEVWDITVGGVGYYCGEVWDITVGGLGHYCGEV